MTSDQPLIRASYLVGETLSKEKQALFLIISAINYSMPNKTGISFGILSKFAESGSVFSMLIPRARDK